MINPARRLGGLAMRFRVGDLIRNKTTQEDGRVVRLVEKNGRVSYVVVVPAGALRGEKEALWRQHEVNDEQCKRTKEIAVNPPRNEISMVTRSG